MAVTYLATALY